MAWRGAPTIGTRLGEKLPCAAGPPEPRSRVARLGQRSESDRWLWLAVLRAVGWQRAAGRGATRGRADYTEGPPQRKSAVRAAGGTARGLGHPRTLGRFVSGDPGAGKAGDRGAQKRCLPVRESSSGTGPGCIAPYATRAYGPSGALEGSPAWATHREESLPDGSHRGGEGHREESRRRGARRRGGNK